MKKKLTGSEIMKDCRRCPFRDRCPTLLQKDKCKGSFCPRLSPAPPNHDWLYYLWKIEADDLFRVPDGWLN
jgi:hypothetical protein